jgi:hypothetical protein
VSGRITSFSGWISAFIASLIGLAALIALAAHAYMGQFSRYIADDFCTAGTLATQGLWQSQQYWYVNWSGRYSFTFFMSLSQLLGSRLTPALPAIALLAWMAASAILLRLMLIGLGRQSGLSLALVLASLLIFGIVQGAPNIYQSLYWQTGMFTYVVPLILWTIYVAWLLALPSKQQRDIDPWMQSLLAAVTALVIGGFSETFASLQAAALAMGLGLLVLDRKREGSRRLLHPLTAAFAGALLAMVAIIAAPGNAVRAGTLPARQSLLAALFRSLRDGYIFSVWAARNNTVMVILLVAVPLVLIWLFARPVKDAGLDGRRHMRLFTKVIFIPAATALLVLATIVPYEYGIGSYPDGRVLITSIWVLACGLVLWGISLGELAVATVSKRPPARSAMLILGLVLAGLACRQASLEFSQALQKQQQAVAYAAAWDKRDEILRAASAGGRGKVEAASLRHMGGLAELDKDPSVWINRCIAQAYGLDQVVAK